jgi:hypothetical protein
MHSDMPFAITGKVMSYLEDCWSWASSGLSKFSTSVAGAYVISFVGGTLLATELKAVNSIGW